MHNLIVRQRQHEILVERVHETEGHFVVMVLAVYRVFGHIGQGVVHPAHVPFVSEAEAAVVHGFRHARPGGGLLGVGGGAVRVYLGVQAAQKLDGFEVFIAAKFVGQPLAVLARVIEV